MPPRCCLKQIPLYHVRPHLNDDEVALFKAKYQEWTTPNPLYCPIGQCSAFIPDQMAPQVRTDPKGKQREDSSTDTTNDTLVSCPKCKINICTICRSPAHGDDKCKPSEFHGVDEQTAELIKQWGYKKCPKCGNAVKRMYGCRYMECRCVGNWCWFCLRGIDECHEFNCVDENEDSGEYGPDEEAEDLTHEPPNLPSASKAGNQTSDTPQTATWSTSKSNEKDPPPTVEEPVVPPRVRNLDGGSHKYWFQQNLDFGNNPGLDFSDTWYCTHVFETSKVKLADACTKDSPGNNMECMKCWARVYPEIEMPPSARNKSRTTVPATKSSRTPASPIRLISSAQPQSTNTPILGFSFTVLDDTTTSAFSSPLSTPPAWFQRFSTSTPHRDSQDDSQTRTVDTHDNTATTGKSADQGQDQEIPDWIARPLEDKDTSSRASFATQSTPFSFAYECKACRILVCHRCKAPLEAEAEAKQARVDAVTAQF